MAKGRASEVTTGTTKSEGAGRSKPEKAVAAGMLAVSGTVVAIGGGGVVLWRAWIAAHGNHGDFWAVAAPGVATGAGTVLLAVVTVWIAARERKRDTWLRQEDARVAGKALRGERKRSDRLRREAQRQRARDRKSEQKRRAKREARKVLATLIDDPPFVALWVTNAGEETITDVWVESAATWLPDRDGFTYLWEPDFSDSDWHGQAYVPDTNRALIRREGLGASRTALEIETRCYRASDHHGRWA